MCCHLPRGSVKRKSTYLASCSLIISMIFFGSDIGLSLPSMVVRSDDVKAAAGATTGYPVSRPAVETRMWDGSDCVFAFLPRADADRLFDRSHENFAVADTAGVRGVLD